MIVAAPPAVTVAELVAAVRAQQGGGAALETFATAESPRPTARASLLVVAAHAGAGATAVSVALADALGRFDLRVQLIDAAPSERSGMLGATDHDMANAGNSWRTGRRSAITVLRPVHTTSPADLPPLPPTESDVVVTDAGTDWRTLTSEPNPLWPPGEGTELLVVCRATVPGVRHAEPALAALPGNPFVVGVGARRWPTPVSAAFGPRLGRAVSEGRVGLIPADRRLELNGIDTEPFAKPVAAAAAQLSEVIWPGLSGAPANQTKKGRRR